MVFVQSDLLKQRSKLLNIRLGPFRCVHVTPRSVTRCNRIWWCPSGGQRLWRFMVGSMMLKRCIFEESQSASNCFPPASIVIQFEQKSNQTRAPTDCSLSRLASVPTPFNFRWARESTLTTSRTERRAPGLRRTSQPSLLLPMARDPT